jgi:hypothetical protein
MSQQVDLADPGRFDLWDEAQEADNPRRAGSSRERQADLVGR